MASAADNPFRVQRIHALSYRAPDFDRDALLTRLEALDYRAAVVGPHGHGKSTLLNELAEALAARGWTCHRLFSNTEKCGVPPDFYAGIVPSLGRHDIVLHDGADLLNLAQWTRFSRAVRKAGGLVITSHRKGRLPTLFECRTSEPLMLELLAELAPGDADQLAPHAKVLLEEHRGDLREVFLALYDLYASSDQVARQ